MWQPPSSHQAVLSRYLSGLLNRSASYQAGRCRWRADTIGGGRDHAETGASVEARHPYLYGRSCCDGRNRDEKKGWRKKDCEISDLTFGRSNRGAGMDWLGGDRAGILSQRSAHRPKFGMGSCRWAGIDTESSVLACSAKGERARALAPALTDCVASTIKFSLQVGEDQMLGPKAAHKELNDSWGGGGESKSSQVDDDSC